MLDSSQRKSDNASAGSLSGLSFGARVMRGTALSNRAGRDLPAAPGFVALPLPDKRRRIQNSVNRALDKEAGAVTPYPGQADNLQPAPSQKQASLFACPISDCR